MRFTFHVIETILVDKLCEVEADTVDEAERRAARGETVNETTLRDRGVLSREVTEGTISKEAIIAEAIRVFPNTSAAEGCQGKKLRDLIIEAKRHGTIGSTLIEFLILELNDAVSSNDPRVSAACGAVSKAIDDLQVVLDRLTELA